MYYEDLVDGRKPYAKLYTSSNTTTGFINILRYCTVKAVMCPYANEIGYCMLTACVRSIEKGITIP